MKLWFNLNKYTCVGYKNINVLYSQHNFKYIWLSLLKTFKYIWLSLLKTFIWKYKWKEFNKLLSSSFFYIYKLKRIICENKASKYKINITSLSSISSWISIIRIEMFHGRICNFKVQKWSQLRKCKALKSCA